MTEVNTQTVGEKKTGPMLGKKEVNVAALTEDWVSDVEGHSGFTVTATDIGSGSHQIDYVDALGFEHSETFSANGEILRGGPPDSSHPIPLWVIKIKSSSTVNKVEVAF